MEGIEVLEPVTSDAEFRGSFASFPETLFVIALGEGKYACNNVTTPAPDPMTCQGLSCFISESAATDFLVNYKTANYEPKVEASTFDKARDMVIDKPVLDCLILWVGGVMAELHFVR